MESIKFEALLKSVEMGSLTRAAEELGYTQAGLTHMMSRLEKELGITLLIRSKSGVSLTSAGEELLPYMKQFTEAGSALDNAIENIKLNNDKILRIASYSSITNHWLPLIINKFSETNSITEIELHVVESLDEIYSLVSSGEMDIGFGSRGESTRCEWIHLHDDPLYAVLPPNTKWYGDDVPLSYFEEKPFFVPTYGSDFDILKLLRTHNVTPKLYQTALDDATVVSMVSHRLGVSIMPKMILAGMNGNVVTKPLVANPYRELGIIVRSKSALSPTARKFINCCKSIVNEIQIENGK